jgi:hypothetical protein
LSVPRENTLGTEQRKDRQEYKEAGRQQWSLFHFPPLTIISVVKRLASNALPGLCGCFS